MAAIGDVVERCMVAGAAVVGTLEEWVVVVVVVEEELAVRLAYEGRF